MKVGNKPVGKLIKQKKAEGGEEEKEEYKKRKTRAHRRVNRSENSFQKQMRVRS